MAVVVYFVSQTHLTFSLRFVILCVVALLCETAQQL